MTDEESPFVITLYDKDFVRQGWLGDPESVVAVPVHNGIGDASITVGSGNAKLPLLMERGARVTIEYQGEYLIGGKVRAKKGQGPSLNGSMTFTVVDDFRLFHRISGWPVPTAALNAQTSEYHTLSGPAETVVKAAVTANAINRLGEPVTVGPDLGRGDNITTAFRFHPLADRLFPAVDTAGIGVTVRQQGSGLIVDCYTPQLHPRTLTEAGGVVTEWEWDQAEAEATDVIVGGQGEGTLRTFVGYTDPALAEAIGERIEVFRDARDSGVGDVYGERAAETFAETAQKSGLSVKLSETSVFRYGGPGGVRVGDRVSLEVGAGLTITDTLRSVAISWTRSNGLEVVPAIGEISDNTDQELAQAIATVAAGVRDLRRK
ncbi:siphovirus ReqiPepy6 Gp37-like family protein [Pseudarthrobacter cellobiosi]|uniref:siphovirus ReqiPepy6 Gp37-like family protein n=1 Tax=Pseudarthrobacter cellobiosi TaxID=2953654 RepID=UPI00208FD928|nr:siphovirus ReqiPepy6 Gp37-like family protein [Pseudarthrobacter sp. HLT1-5]MCO4256516.1 siphovirus ReqiPepy6 Gp37-like family protein [Pseudarthrobacter sp. HLT1-5]